jgi:hypothetical protein
MARRVAHVHDLKLDALADLVEEMNGQPLLVAYEFKADLERLHARFGANVPHLGSGVSEKVAVDVQERWNSGKIPLLFAHPASVGHGLNLQRGGASHICWFSATWDLELWEQFIRRLWRQGNTADRVVNHILAVKGTIDELKLAAVDDKGITQARLLQGLIAEVSDGPKEDYMTGFQRLPRAGESIAQPEAAAADSAPRAIKGWGNLTAKASAPAEKAAVVDKPAMVARISRRAVEPQSEAEAEAPPPAARTFFSPSVQASLGGDPVQESGEGSIQSIQKEPEPKPRAARKTAGEKIADPRKDTADVARPLDLSNTVGGANPYVNIQLNGLSQAAIRAALQAIADNL